MKVYSEINLKDFNTWAGANSTKDELFEYELDNLEVQLEDYFRCEAISETELNDILWFETDFVAECLGFNSWEELVEAREAREEDQYHINQANKETYYGWR